MQQQVQQHSQSRVQAGQWVDDLECSSQANHSMSLFYASMTLQWDQQTSGSFTTLSHVEAPGQCGGTAALVLSAQVSASLEGSEI